MRRFVRPFSFRRRRAPPSGYPAGQRRRRVLRPRTPVRRQRPFPASHRAGSWRPAQRRSRRFWPGSGPFFPHRLRRRRKNPRRSCRGCARRSGRAAHRHPAGLRRPPLPRRERGRSGRSPRKMRRAQNGTVRYRCWHFCNSCLPPERAAIPAALCFLQFIS